MKALDLFPNEAPKNAGISLQGRIMLRNQTVLFMPSDIPRLVELGMLEATDDPDQAQRIGTHGFPPPSLI